MNTSNRRLVSVFAALVWASVLLHFVITGRISLYLAPIFRQYTMLGGIGLVVLALFVLFTHKQTAACGHDHEPGEAHDHEASDLSPAVILGLMVVPVVFAACMTKDSFSIKALTHKGAFDLAARPLAMTRKGAVPSREEIVAARPRTEAGVTRLELLELFSAAMDGEYAESLTGMEISVEGRIITTHEKGGYPILYRLLLTCCAADGRPLPLRLKWQEKPTEIMENDWVEAIGIISFEKGTADVRIPTIEVRSIKPKKAPPEESHLRY